MATLLTGLRQGPSTNSLCRMIKDSFHHLSRTTKASLTQAFSLRRDCEEADVYAVFMRRLWDFVNHFPRDASKITRRKIPSWVHEDPERWSRLLPAYNMVLFLDSANHNTLQAYTDACMYGLGGFYFDEKGSWDINKIDQSRAFCALVKGKDLPANRKLLKDPHDPNINVHEVEEILLLF